MCSLHICILKTITYRWPAPSKPRVFLRSQQEKARENAWVEYQARDCNEWRTAH